MIFWFCCCSLVKTEPDMEETVLTLQALCFRIFSDLALIYLNSAVTDLILKHFV